jgi:hypothetical protein
VICSLAAADVELWPRMQEEIAAWAKSQKVILFSVEARIEGIVSAANPNKSEDVPDCENDPKYILRAFADAEQIDDRLFAAGIELLKEARG